MDRSDQSRFYGRSLCRGGMEDNILRDIGEMELPKVLQRPTKKILMGFTQGRGHTLLVVILYEQQQDIANTQLNW